MQNFYVFLEFFLVQNLSQNFPLTERGFVEYAALKSQ